MVWITHGWHCLELWQMLCPLHARGCLGLTALVASCRVTQAAGKSDDASQGVTLIMVQPLLGLVGLGQNLYCKCECV